MKVLVKYLTLLSFLVVLLPSASNAQRAAGVQDVFMEYLQNNLPLNSQEALQLRPLVKNYLKETRLIHRNFNDVLLRNKNLIDLKIDYRKKFTTIIGADRANRFFEEELRFRKKVRDELQQRRENKKFNG